LKDIVTHEHGIILELQEGTIIKRATYLPQVWEQLPNFNDFFISLAQKAGILWNILELHPHIKIYKVDNIKE
jgi:uncharacterized protein